MFLSGKTPKYLRKTPKSGLKRHLDVGHIFSGYTRVMREVKELQQWRAKPGVLSMTGEEGEERGTPGREHELSTKYHQPEINKREGEERGSNHTHNKMARDKKCGDDDGERAEERWTRGRAESNTLISFRTHDDEGKTVNVC